MKNLITLALLFTLFSCEKEDSTGTKNWFPYEIETIYYHPDTLPRIKFKGSSSSPTDFSDVMIVITRSGSLGALVATDLGVRPAEGFELIYTDFKPEILSAEEFADGTFSVITIDNGDSTKILYL